VDSADQRIAGSADDSPGLTPFQTVGPFFAVLPLEGEATAVGAGHVQGEIIIAGTVRDGAGAVMPDALIETWQADPAGRYDATDASFRGFARAMTDESGRYEIRTLMPGSIAAGHARHVLIGILARGILTRLVTRVYFPDDPAHATDPVLTLVPPDRRGTLIAVAEAPDRFRFDIVIQGQSETVFFDA
jgi:protocatechuate 3,4-dioxygenase alpha subunit